VVDIGDILAGKYKVERVLGRGGMGYVVAARHNQLDQQVAIKILMPELCENEDAVARFLREARASVRIQNDHIARVLDVGTLDDGAPYMVMEFLEGRDLAHELEDRHLLPVGEAVDFMLQACEALAEAHALGIVHRDLKPANLFRTRRPDGSPFIKVLDFGISKAIVPDAKAVSLTSTQGLIGSPFYMSPEQVRKPKTVDTRSDIWSLGVILHELLSGAPPFLSDTPLSILAAVVTDPAPLVRSMRDDVPEGLQAVILKCLEKEPARRYADIPALAHALSPFAPIGAAAAVARISAIARSAKERVITGGERAQPTSDVPTLESRKPLHDTPTLESPRVSVEDQLKQTDAGWGHSKSMSGRSRKRLAAAAMAAAATFGASWFAWRWFAPSPPADGPKAASSNTSEDTPKAASSHASASVTAALPQVVVDAEPSPVEASIDAQAPAAKEASSSAVSTGRPVATGPKRTTKGAGGGPPSDKPASTRPPSPPGEPSLDPLDGRR
jgi:eukaryotic-like serine/threonine-protein kinase